MVRWRLMVAVVALAGAACTEPDRTSQPTTTTASPSSTVSQVSASPADPVRSSPPAQPKDRTPRIQYTLDVASRPDGTAALLGQTCFADSSCTTWVRWSSDAGRTFPRATQRVVVDSPPPTNGEPEGSTLNRLALGPSGTAWVWAAGQPEDAAQLLYTTTDDGRTWDNSGEAGYRDVQVSGNEAWVLGSTCKGMSTPLECASTLTPTPAGANPYDTSTQLALPEYRASRLTLRRVGRSEAFLLTAGGESLVFRLWHTRDGAESWRKAALPQACTQAVNISLAAQSGGFAWVDCQDEPTVSAPATLWQTADAGAHWRQLPRPPLFHFAADLTLLSRRHAVITSGGRADVQETTDGGSTWRSVLPYQEIGYGPIQRGTGGVLFAVLYRDDEARPGRSSLWRRSGPGNRWEKVSLPA